MSVATETFNAQAVIHHACQSKHAYTDPADARKAAKDQTRKTGEQVRAYRCPFGDGCNKHAHWHCGSIPSLEGLETIARAIRELHQS